MSPILRALACALLAVLAACSPNPPGGDDVPVDAAPDAPEVPIDAIPLPACVTPPAGPSAAACRECLIGPRLSPDGSACTVAVCSVDLSCCEQLWDERCTELADDLCPIAPCIDSVSFAGFRSVTWGRRDGTGFDTGSMTSTPDLWIEMPAWGDADGDGDVDLATAGECIVRILRNDGWTGGELQLTPVFEHAPIGTCPGASDERYRGHRAFWADLDRDGDLDAAFSGAMGVFWVRQTAGAFLYAGEIVAAADGLISDLALADVDDDHDTDAIVSFTDRVTRLYRRSTTGFTHDPTWAVGQAPVAMMARCDLTGDARRELVLSNSDGIRGYAVAPGGFGTELFPYHMGGTQEFACGDVDDDGKDELVAVGNNQAVRVFDGNNQGTLLWASESYRPPLRLYAVGIDLGDLDGDGDVDIVVAEGSQTLKNFHLFWNDGISPPSFVHEEVTDWLPGLDTRGAEMITLPVPQ